MAVMAMSISTLFGRRPISWRRRNPFRNVAPAAVAGIIVSVIVISVLNRRR